jgi:hypothetical protein
MKKNFTNGSTPQGITRRWRWADSSLGEIRGHGCEIFSRCWKIFSHCALFDRRQKKALYSAQIASANRRSFRSQSGDRLLAHSMSDPLLQSIDFFCQKIKRFRLRHSISGG